MDAITFLRKKYHVPSDKMLSEILELPHYTWWDVCELLDEYKKNVMKNIITAEQFIEEYRIMRKMTKQEIKDFLLTQVALPCACNSKYCKDWAFVNKNKSSILAHSELYM